MELICGFVSIFLSVLFAYACDAACAANANSMPAVIFGLSAIGFAILGFAFFVKFIIRIFQ